MVWHAKPIRLSAKQRGILEQVRNARTSKQAYAQRAAIILLANEGESTRRIGRELGIGREMVAQWRNRWVEQAASLAEAELAGAEDRDDRKRILAMLDDAPRSGCRGKFSPEQICQIIAVACESAQDCGLPVSHWSLRSLAQEVVARGIVDSISVSKLHVFLKSGRIKTAQDKNLDSHAGTRRGSVPGGSRSTLQRVRRSAGPA